jgi:hypothetical protein
MTVKQALNKLLTGVEKAYKSDLKRFKSSGSTEKSIKKESTIGKDIYGKVSAQESIYYLMHGRKPGKFPPISAMLEYIRAKRIKPKGKISEKSLAFLFARSIAKKGTKIYQGKVKALNVDDQIEKLQKEFAENLNISFKKVISNYLSRANDF